MDRCAAAGPNMAQLVCTNAQCTVVLMYPRGASQVQCSVCGHVNDAMAVRPHPSSIARCILSCTPEQYTGGDLAHWSSTQGRSGFVVRS